MSRSRPLRLGSFNLLSGRSRADGLIETERLIEAARQLDVDLLAVQEVDRHQPRSGGVDQAALIAQTLGAVDHRFVAALDGTPGVPGWTPSVPVPPATPPRDAQARDAQARDAQARDVQAHDAQAHDAQARDLPPGGLLSVTENTFAQFGVALISRLPVAEWHVLRLRPARGRFPLPIPSRPPQLLWLNDEPRVVVAAVLEQPRITIACTHLSFVPLSTLRQLRTVHRWLAGLPGPQVLLGDLNLPGPVVRRVTGWTPLVSSPTFPSPAPRVQLDHALAAGLPAGFRATGRVRQLPISDHRALLVDLDLPAT